MPLALKPQKRVSEIDFAKVDELARALGCDALFAQVLYNRGFEDVESAKRFLYPDSSSLLDPFSMLNMDKAVEQIKRAKEQNKKVTVYGDYDVDGISATAILCLALIKFGINAYWYIPKRKEEGYGLNETAVEKIFACGTDLLITVDCGIAQAELIKKFTDSGHEIIVTDHHSIGEKIPACTVLKPGQPGDEYKNTDLCGAGIAFKVAQALLGAEAEELIDFACVATIADVVSLKGENKYLVKRGLEKINQSPRDCFKALLDAAEFSGTVTAQTVGFAIAPRLNAAGRMETASIALKLLLSEGEEAKERSQELCAFNLRRQEAEKEILDAINKQIAEESKIRDKKVLVFCGKDWHEGVIGICAARIAESYHRPCIILSLGENGIAKGSGRSVEGIDLFAMLDSAKKHLVQFGGHTMAAGLSVREENISALENALDQFVRENYDLKILYPVAKYDAKSQIDKITVDFCKRLELLEPCGSGNESVSIRLDSCSASGMKRIGSGQNHLKLFLQDPSGRASAVAFNFEKHACDYFNLQLGSAIVKPEINLWQGRESVSLKIADIKEQQNPKPRQRAEKLTAMFYSRLAFNKNGIANVQVIEDSEELAYQISQWDDEDISGTLILCDHPEYASGCIQILEDEAPRFDVSFSQPISNTNGYNALVLGAEIDKIDFSPYKRIVFFDMLNFGFADFIKEKAPWAETYVLKCGLELFDSIFEEYKQLDRENMLLAYKAIVQSQGRFESEIQFIESVSENRQINMPLIQVALITFSELGFINVTNENGFSVTVNKDAPKRSLEESRYYTNILKCLRNRK